MARWRISRGLSTVARLVVINALVSIVVLGLVVSQVVRSYTSRVNAAAATSLAQEVPQFSQAANLRPGNESIFQFSRSYLATHAVVNQHILFIHIFGQSVLGSASALKVAHVKLVSSYISHPPGSTSVTKVTAGSTSYLVMGSPIKSSGKVIGSLVGVENLSGVTSQESQVVTIAVLEAFVALVFSVVAGYILLRRVMEAVGRIALAATEIANGDLDRRLGDMGRDDEVGELAAAFDLMIARLSRTLDSQRRLLADVSHQLKTPLTVIRMNLELITRSDRGDIGQVDEAIGVSISEIDYMKTMLDGMLLLERMSETDALVETEVSLREFLLEIFTSALVLGRREWHLGEIPDLVVRIDESKLKGAILNLLDNAVGATTRGGQISLEARADSGVIEISVEDDGDGIDKEHLQTIFDRFERGASVDKRGAGLGLAIVKAVVTAHGGSVSVASEPGRGSTFTVTLPMTRIVNRS